jgi:colanic acid/amylovoran biosynthesis glycosyltransferase
MRVAFAHYLKPGDISGVTSWLLRLTAFLRESGVEVGVHLLEVAEADPSESALAASLRGQGADVFQSPRTNRLKRDVLNTLAFLNRWQPDVFLPQCEICHYIAAAVAGRQGLPWALTMHSDDPFYWAVYDHLHPLQNGGRVVSVSQHIQSEFALRHQAETSLLIPYGVLIPDRATTFQSAPFRVVYSGRLWEHQKRITLVVQALIQACLASGQIVATVIGDGHARGACEQLVSQAGLKDRISFVGQQPFASIQEILLHSQAILLMSDFEGLPVALLEAMAAGAVPVARSIPSGIPELVIQQQTGLLVGDAPESAAAALVALAADQALWERCSGQARQLVERQYNQETSNNLWRETLFKLKETSVITDPVEASLGRGIVSSLPPLLTASYHQGGFLQRLKLRSKADTVVAQFKGRIKRRLRPDG